MARPRLDVDGVTTTAMTIVDEQGFDALSLSAVAAVLGVGPSALYSHVDGLDGLREAVAVESTRRLADAVRTAAIGAAGDDAVRAVAHAYRAFARDHPGRFAATVQVRVTGASIERVRGELDAVFSLLYRAPGSAAPAVGAAARNARRAIHGFLVVRHCGDDGSGPSGDATDGEADADYDALIEALCRMLDPAA